MRNPVVAAVALVGLGVHVARRLVVDPRTRRVRRGLLGVGGVVAVALGAHAFLVHRSTRELAAAYDALRARSEPITLAEMAPAPCPRDANLATLVNPALALMVKEPEGEDGARLADAIDALEHREEPGSEGRALIAKHLAANAEALARIEQALTSGRTRCVFDVDVSDPLEITLPHLLSLKTMARLLALRAESECEADPDRALATLGLATQMQSTLDEEPFMISLLVRLAMQSAADAALARILSRCAPSERALRAFDSRVAAAAPPREAVTRALRAELPWAREIFTRARRGQPLPEPLGGSMSWSWRLHLLSAWRVNEDELEYVRTMSELVSSSRTLEGKARHDAAFRWDQREESAAAKRSTSITRLLLPACGKFVAKHLTAETKRAAVRAAIALRLERMRTGQYPEKLEPCPVDGNTGAPVSYARDGKGFVISWPSGNPELPHELRVTR